MDPPGTASNPMRAGTGRPASRKAASRAERKPSGGWSIAAHARINAQRNRDRFRSGLGGRFAFKFLQQARAAAVEHFVDLVELVRPPVVGVGHVGAGVLAGIVV